jgi:hypothetical protein
LSDQSKEFDGSCNRCYEVRCRNANFTDGFGERLQRSKACYNTSQSVVVRIVDACPCVKQGNEFSNKRWCCGDKGSKAAHMDLSIWAFERLAPTNLGVIGIQFREVKCTYKPAAFAPRPRNPTPVRSNPPPGARPEGPKCFAKRTDPLGARQGAISARTCPANVEGEVTTVQAVESLPEQRPERPTKKPACVLLPTWRLYSARGWGQYWWRRLGVRHRPSIALGC